MLAKMSKALAKPSTTARRALGKVVMITLLLSKALTILTVFKMISWSLTTQKQQTH